MGLFKAAVAGGSAEAMNDLGYAYLNGRGGLTADKVIARSYFEEATSRGDRAGQANLAYMYEVGWGGSEP